MKSKNLKVLFPLLILSTGLIIGASFGAISLIKNTAEVSLKDEYLMGDTIYVPNKQVNCDGILIDGKPSVKFPSGNIYAIEDSFVASEGGKYEVIYTVEHNNKTYTSSDYFVAVRKATDLFTLSEGNTSNASITQEAYIYDGSYYGVKTTISSGASVYFNQIIDFNDLSMDVPIFSVLIEPHCSNGSDFQQIEFLFTDVDDPTNTLTMIFSAGDGYGYLRAGGKGQDLKGWQNFDGNKTSKVHTNNFGNPCFTSFDRDVCESRNNNYPLKAFFNPNTVQLYASNTRCFPWGTTPSFVIDFDEPNVWGDNIWKGFTSGKATLKITPKSVSSATSTLVFIDINGNSLANNKFYDVEAPTLTLDKIASGTAPQAKVGEPYQLFSYNAIDVFDGQIDANIAVQYVNPTNHAKSDVEILNNAFTPNVPGIYEITYVATDRSGNASSKVVSVVASNNVTPLTLSIDDVDKSIEVFQEVNVLPTNEVLVSGGSGEAKLFRTIYSPKGRMINLDGDVLSLDDVGDYKVVYEAIDYLGHHGSKTIKITSLNRVKPKIMGTFSFPDALLKGFSYDIPTLYAKECVDNEVVTKEASVLINGKLWTESSFVADGETMRIQYAAKGATGQEERISKEYIVRDGEGGKRQDNYFLCEDSEVVLERNYVEYKTKSDVNKTSFINKINSRSFTLVFNYDFSTFNASGVSITLEDESRTHTFTMDISISKTDCKLDYPGCAIQQTVATQSNMGVNSMRISYNSAKGTITDINSNVVGMVTKDDNGKAFPGFEGYVYLSVSIIEPDPVVGSSIMLEKLSNQTLGYRAKDISRCEDTISPEIYLDYEFNRKQIIGSTFTVPKALSCDILNPIETFTVDMYSRDEENKPKDKILTGEDASVEHTFKLTTYDNYLIRYTSIDAAGNEVVATRLLYVIENQPPVLEVDYSNIKKVYYQGDVIGLPTYKVSDNSEHYEVNIYVMDPHSRMYLLQNDVDGVVKSLFDLETPLYNDEFIASSNTWVALITGEYRFKVVVTDSCYNYSSSEFTFHVISK